MTEDAHSCNHRGIVCLRDRAYQSGGGLYRIPPSERTCSSAVQYLIQQWSLFFILLFLTVKHFAGPSFDNYTMSCSMQGKKVKNCDFNNWAKVTSFFVCSFCLSLALSLGVRITSGILTIERVKCMAGPRICGTVSSRSPNSESVLFRSLNSIRVSYLSKWIWFSAYGYVK